MKYAWIAKHKHCWPIALTCEVLDVSVSGYFEHQRNQGRHKTHAADGTNPSKRVHRDVLLVHIRAIHAEVKGEYGWPKIHRELHDRGVRVGKERVRKIMQREGIRAFGKKKFVVTTDSAHTLAVAPNLLARNFVASAPNQVWTTDITYIATNEGWLFLAVMIDLHSRMVVGWSMQAHMQSSLVTDALRMAYFRRKPAAGLIVHSDRGSQYCGQEFQRALKEYAMKSSMSRKGDCWDNAPTESFWGHLKVARIHGKRFATRREAKDEIVDWLSFYNAKRLHQTLGYVSPATYEKRWLIAQNNNQIAA